ncbi:hypothetical protein EIN_097010 [Entamoeba invadens IP1]|uniref:NXF1/2/3/5-like leucine-rich repeat domain-containing protein n=1 Tax=Entamoeba invadens IP1 TaxID=370355 RepID=A0A0A1U0L6_ENTIV|nr:hypothetical protein EIN_097010 [Entamoeba invadens IP1]ELP87434.1 hypothetical protein EIN_097010 [Entamoeba invadens IP1]|eukprot:XP_004254205.1 hypothetical protein EIN_097010 [Entamoeba invadens IP1]
MDLQWMEELKQRARRLKDPKAFKIKVIITGFIGTQIELAMWLNQRFEEDFYRKFPIFKLPTEVWYIEPYGEELIERILAADGKSEYRNSFISLTPQPLRTKTNELKPVVLELIRRWYNTSTQLLCINNLAQKLKECGWKNGFDKITFANTLKMLGEQIPMTLGVDCHSNQLNSLEPLRNLTLFFPSLQLLDLRENNIQTLDQLGYIKGLQLIEIDLNGNPIITQNGFIAFDSS